MGASVDLLLGVEGPAARWFGGGGKRLISLNEIRDWSVVYGTRAS